MFRYSLLCCLLLAVLAARADQVFTMRDYVHHAWSNELVTYQRVLPPALTRGAELIDAAGKPVPVQIRPLEGGKSEIAFLVDTLPADGEVRYTLRPGKRVEAPLAESVGGMMVLDAGRVAVRVPAPGERSFKTSMPAGDVVAPLLGVRGSSGAWVGAGHLLGDLPVIAVKTILVSNGPVYAETRTEYTLQCGYYHASVRVVRGQEAVFVREEFNTTKAAIGKLFFSFSLTEGFNPDRVAGEMRTWGELPDKITNGLGTDYRLPFAADRRELSILGYCNWWPATAVRATLYHAGAANGDAFTILPSRIGRWRNPMGMYLMTTATKRVSLDLPLYIDQHLTDDASGWLRDGMEWGSPYSTGLLEAGWPRTAGRREWVLQCSTLGEVLPEKGRSSVTDAIVRYCDLPLDKVKDWVLDWKSDPKITYPRLFIEPSKLEAIRARVQAYPRWTSRFGQYWNREFAYAVTKDPVTGKALALGGDTLAKPESWQDAGSMQSLRQYTRLLFDVGYKGHPAPNNARPMGEMVKFDAAMSYDGLTDDQRSELRHLMAFIANMVYDEDWNPIRAGFHRGNPNMPPRQEHHLGVASALFPDHPLAPVWAKRGQAEATRMIDSMVRDGGSWRECPHYEYDAAMYPLFQSAVPMKFSGRYNLFAQPKLKSTWNYLMNICTPPDPRFAIRLLPAFGNGSWEPVPLFGWMANLTREDDPAFSKHMQWIWIEQGRPDTYKYSETLIDPTLPAEQPNLVSTNFPGFGAILRNGFPAKDESWVAFRMGEDHEHYNYGDQGSFMYYAKGAPLVLQFGSTYSPQYRGAWYFNRVSIGHQEVQPGLFGGTEYFSAQGDPEYPGHMIGFAGLRAADYAVGQHVSSRQGLVPDDARTALPPNAGVPLREIPRHVWTRQMLLVKSFTPDGQADPTGPTYLAMKDTIASDKPLPGEWNLWLPMDTVDTTANPVRCQSPFGVQLDIFMADPAQPKWTTRQDTQTFLHGPSNEYWAKVNPGKKWSETLTNLRASQQPGGGFLAILYPRKNTEQPAQFTTLLDGKGVAVTHTRGRDVLFLGLQPVQWTEGDWSFSGSAGVIRREGETLSLVLAAPGEVAAGGIRLKADAPASLISKGHTFMLVNGGSDQTVQITLPANARLKWEGKELKMVDGAFRIAISAGNQTGQLTW
ncbi:MAG TPA: hypothetical protein VGM23_17500 [Armatimonadota bacterium]|jgi:hypothetical protein